MAPFCHASSGKFQRENGPVSGVLTRTEKLEATVTNSGLNSIFAPANARLPPGHDVAWTVERSGVRMRQRTKAPGALQAPLYLY
jgi:hypothetical protein